MFGPSFRHGFRPVACFLLILPTLAQTPQTPKDSRQQEPIRLNTELVVVDAQVVDKRSREFIRGLKPQDFDLFEDDTKQRIEFFGQDQLPLSIVLLLDISPSVRPVIQKIREGALEALRHLKSEDEVALMVFCGWTELIQDFTKDRQLILDKLGAAMDKKGGGTRIHEAIAKAARQMRYATNAASRRVIIAITDNQGSMDRYRDAVSEEDVRQTVLESGATVCGVIVRSLLNVADDLIFQTPQIQEKWKRTTVNPYAEQTGGEIAGASKDEINVRLGEVLDHLRSRYSLGYVPVNQNHNGKFRRIKLVLTPEAKKRLGGEIVVSARQGYYSVDPESEVLLADEKSAAEKTGPSDVRPANSLPSTHNSENQDRPASVAAPPPNSSETKPASAPEIAAATSGTSPVERPGVPARPPETKPVDPPETAPAAEPAPLLEAFNPYAGLVMVDVQAINRRTGASIDNLAREDFQLADNGTSVDIVHFSRRESPLSLILLIDVGGKTPYVMSCLRRNIAGWLRELRPDDEIALMAFGGSAALIQEFTKDRKLIAVGLRDFVDTARQKGIAYGQDRTAAVFQAADHMDQAANPISRRVIITVTDDTPRSHTAAESGATARLLLESRCSVYAMVTKGPRPSRKRQVASAAAQGAIFGLGNPVSIATQIATKLATEAVLDALMKDWAFGQMIRQTGGTAVRIDGEDATDKLVSLLNHIGSRYVVGFAPPPPLSTAVSGATSTGAFHTLKLKLAPEALKRYPEASIATAHGYYVRMPDRASPPDASSPAKDH
jgi:VWFA-related protein